MKLAPREKFCWLALLLSLWGGPGMAETLVGSTVTPVVALPLRTSPPGTFFQSKGDQIGVASPNVGYRVLDETAVPTVLGTEQWLKVQKLSDPSTTGWIYSGAPDSIQSNVISGQ